MQTKENRLAKDIGESLVFVIGGGFFSLITQNINPLIAGLVVSGMIFGVKFHLGKFTMRKNAS